MANGKVLVEYKKKLDAGETIPQNVTNGVILTALAELYGYIEEVREDIQAFRRIHDEDKIVDARNVTWPWIKDNVIVPIIRTAITLGVGYLAFKVTGLAP